MEPIKSFLIMKKILLLLSTIFLLNGCAESLALLGPSATNGRLVQSSLNSAVSYGIKKQTGKTPLEHAIAYAEKQNPEKKQETCVSFIQITRSEVCSIVNKKIALSSASLTEKTSEIIKHQKNSISKKISKIEKIAKASIIYNRR